MKSTPTGAGYVDKENDKRQNCPEKGMTHKYQSLQMYYRLKFSFKIIFTLEQRPLLHQWVQG